MNKTAGAAHSFHPIFAAGLAALLMLASLSARGDELQEISKLLKGGNSSEAMEHVNVYLVAKPKDPQGRFLKGLILTEQNKPTEAIKIFSALTEDHPDLPEPYNNLAVLHASLGQYDKARTALEMAIRTHPSYATAHENLGDIYARMASQAYDKALQLEKGNPTAQTKLAMIKDIFAGGTNNPNKNLKVAAAKSAVAAPAAEKPAADKKSEKGAPPDTSVAATPSATTRAAPNTAPTKDDTVNSTVLAWASAWSGKNVAAYLSFYAVDFKTPGGEPRAAWEQARTERINRPKQIEVVISDLGIQFISADEAQAKFKQSYRSDTLKNKTIKTLTLVKENGKWRIQQEVSK